MAGASTDVDDARCRIGRATLGLTHEDLAAKAGVTPADIHDLETGGLPVPASRSIVAKRVTDAFAQAGLRFHLDEGGRAVMRVETLDGIIEAPVDLRRPL